MTIDEGGSFIWEDVEQQKQSGILESIGTYGGNNFLLSNITYSDYNAGGESDYYSLNRYTLIEDELTLWHGLDVMVFTPAMLPNK